MRRVPPSARPFRLRFSPLRGWALRPGGTAPRRAGTGTSWGEVKAVGAERSSAPPSPDETARGSPARSPAPRRRHSGTAPPCPPRTNAPFPSATTSGTEKELAPSGRSRLVYYFLSPPLAVQAVPPRTARYSAVSAVAAVIILHGGTVRPARVPLRATGARLRRAACSEEPARRAVTGPLPRAAVRGLSPAPRARPLGAVYPLSAVRSRLSPGWASRRRPERAASSRAAQAGALFITRGSVRCWHLGSALFLKKQRQLLLLFLPSTRSIVAFPPVILLCYCLNYFHHRQTVSEVWITVHPSIPSLFFKISHDHGTISS